MAAPRVVSLSRGSKIVTQTVDDGKEQDVSSVRIQIKDLKKHIKSYSVQVKDNPPRKAVVPIIGILKNICSRYPRDTDLLHDIDVQLLIHILQLRSDSIQKTVDDEINAVIIKAILLETGLAMYVEAMAVELFAAWDEE